MSTDDGCSNAGGGGEVVLWTAVAHMQRTEPGLICVVYTGDIDATKDDIITKVKVGSGPDRTKPRPDRGYPVSLRHRP